MKQSIIFVSQIPFQIAFRLQCKNIIKTKLFLCKTTGMCVQSALHTEIINSILHELVQYIKKTAKQILKLNRKNVLETYSHPATPETPCQK
jgi:hypothetical protein